MNSMLVAIVGAIGLTSVFVVFITTMNNIEKRELARHKSNKND